MRLAATLGLSFPSVIPGRLHQGGLSAPLMCIVQASHGPPHPQPKPASCLNITCCVLA